MSDLKERIAKVISERDARVAAKQAADQAAAEEARKAVDKFFRIPMVEALGELQQAFEASGRAVKLRNTTTEASIEVSQDGGRSEIRIDFTVEGGEHIATRVFAISGSSAPGKSYRAAQATKDELVEYVVQQWEEGMKR